MRKASERERGVAAASEITVGGEKQLLLEVDDEKGVEFARLSYRTALFFFYLSINFYYATDCEISVYTYVPLVCAIVNKI